jgi:DNA helicase IV
VQPTLATACAVIDDIARNPPDWLTIRHRQCFRILGSLRPDECCNPKDALREAILRYKRTARRLIRCSSTIHKSKGLEFDHVILANFGATHFKDDKTCRRLAYVALSRACKAIHIIVPARTPSPLL